MIKKIILLALLFQVTSSSFSLSAHLNAIQPKTILSKSLLDYGIKNKNINLMKMALKNEVFGSEKWREILLKMANKDANSAYQLASFYKVKDENAKALLWYQQAARLKHHGASIESALLLLQQKGNSQEALQQAMSTLSLIPSLSEENKAIVPPSIQLQKAIIQIEIAITKGSTALLNRLLLRYADLLLNDEAGQALLKQLAHFNVAFFYQEEVQKKLLSETNPPSKEKNTVLLPFFSNMEQNIHGNKNCLADIQLFATSLQDLKATEQLIKQFKGNPLSQSVCLLPVRYTPLPKLKCDKENLYTRQRTLQCDESYWKNLAEQIKAKYIGIVVPQTSSFVHLGILYLKSGESVLGFSHEVSHLLGFVDEYPIPSKHQKCQNEQDQPFSLNVAVLAKNYRGKRDELRNKILKKIAWGSKIKKTTPILVQSFKPSHNGNKKGETYWQLGTPLIYQNEVGVFQSKTCDNSANKQIGAFKPLSTATHLQYTSSRFPRLYSELLTQYEDTFQMPSYEYNIALKQFQRGQVKQAEHWLTRASLHENKAKRIEKVLNGMF
ncbi:MAG: hypothetical protein ACPGTQ_05790 [Colwellia sp.]